jgi:ABC-type dipeptide/oligopeptide/nickel transport system permease component
MKSRRSSKFLDDVQARQRATIWPDTLRGGRAVDSFLWKGSPDATLVQRVGIAIFALAIIVLAFVGVFLGYAAAFKHAAWLSLFMFLFAFFLAAIGCKLLGNVFRH